MNKIKNHLRFLFIILIIFLLAGGCTQTTGYDGGSDDSVFGSGISETGSEDTEDVTNIETVVREEKFVGSMPKRPEDLPQFVVADTDENDRRGNGITGGGYIAERDGFFYFANQDDEYKLYRMDANFENKKKLSDTPNGAISIDIQIIDDTLFYLVNERLESETEFGIQWESSLYSYDLTQGVERKVLKSNIMSYFVHEGWIYFSTADTFDMYKAKLDGMEIQKIGDSEENVQPVYFDNLQVVGDRLYYNSNEMTHSIGLQFLTSKDSWQEDPSKPSWVTYPYSTLVYDRSVFVINMFSVGLYKFDVDANTIYVDGNDNVSDTNVAVPLGETVFSFTISEGVVYYATSGGSDSKLYKMDTDGKNKEYISDGYSPVVLGNYLFYMYGKDGKIACVAK